MYQRDQVKKIRIGLVGAGSHAYRNILPTLTYLPVELVAIADVNGERAAQTARQYGVRSYGDANEMYRQETLDAVILCVSPGLHPSLAVAAFKAGLHVWLEKPAGTRIAEIDAMIAARGDRACVVGLKKAFMPATRKALDLLRTEVTTPVMTAIAVYPMAIPRDGRRILEERTFTPWLADGCHPLALLVTMCGPVASVTVQRGRDGGGFCLLHHDNGAVSSLVLAEGIPRFQPFERYLFIARDRSIEIENSRKVTLQRGIPFVYAQGTSFAPEGNQSGALVWECQDSMNTLENKAVFTQGLFGSLQHFCESVLAGETPSIGTLELARHLTGIYEAGLLSEGDTVAVAGFRP